MPTHGHNKPPTPKSPQEGPATIARGAVPESRLIPSLEFIGSVIVCLMLAVLPMTEVFYFIFAGVVIPLIAHLSWRTCRLAGFTGLIAPIVAVIATSGLAIVILFSGYNARFKEEQAQKAQLNDIQQTVHKPPVDSPPSIALLNLTTMPNFMSDGNNRVEYHFINGGGRSATVQIVSEHAVLTQGYKKSFLVSKKIFLLPNVPTSLLPPTGTTNAYYQLNIPPGLMDALNGGRLNFFIDTLVRYQDTQTNKIYWNPVCYYYDSIDKYLKLYPTCPTRVEFDTGDPYEQNAVDNKGCVLWVHKPIVPPLDSSIVRTSMGAMPGTCYIEDRPRHARKR